MPNFASLTTSMPNGLTNAQLAGTMASSGIPDPTYSHLDNEDFNRYSASDWTVTLTGTGTVALTAAIGGRVLLTTTAGATDAIFMQRPVASYQFTANKQTFIKFLCQMADVTNDVLYVGLLNTTTAPLSATDGVYLKKSTGAATFTLTSVVGGVSTTVALPTACVPTNGVDFEIGIMVDQKGNVGAYFNPLTGTQVAPYPEVSPFARGVVAVLPTPGLTTALLATSFGIQNGAASAKTMQVDFITVSQER